MDQGSVPYWVATLLNYKHLKSTDPRSKPPVVSRRIEFPFVLLPPTVQQPALDQGSVLDTTSVLMLYAVMPDLIPDPLKQYLV